jgi:hypothetical protein
MASALQVLQRWPAVVANSYGSIYPETDWIPFGNVGSQGRFPSFADLDACRPYEWLSPAYAGAFWSVCLASAREAATFCVRETRVRSGLKARLLRDLFGNPFRLVVLDPAWLSPGVLALARAAHDERVMPSGELDGARLAVLADALEEAGCTSAEVLGTCAGQGPRRGGGRLGVEGRGGHAPSLLAGLGGRSPLAPRAGTGRRPGQSTPSWKQKFAARPKAPTPRVTRLALIACTSSLKRWFGLWAVPRVVVAATVTRTSAVLNCWAFLRHK